MTNSTAGMTALWSGSYTADADGHGEGIGALNVHDDGTLDWADAAVEANSPSFIATHPSLPVVYAVAEFAQTVRAYAVTGPATLEPLGDPWPAGAAVCHIALDPAGRYALAACWGDGTVVAYELDVAGAIVARHASAAATDPYANLVGDIVTASNAAPRTSRAHASIVLPDGRILTTDLGYDLARIWRFEVGAGLVADHEVSLPAGSGPRHPVLHASGQVSIVTEYSLEVVTLAAGADGRYAITDVAPVFAGGPHDGDAGAHITLTESGEYAHVTVRGSNRIAVLAVRDGGARLEPTADVDCGGTGPRHHMRAGSLLYVTNQLSNTVSAFRLDEHGIPAEHLGSIAVGSPTCLIPQR